MMEQIVDPPKEIQCPTCYGTGWIRGIWKPGGIVDGELCPDCDGTGKVEFPEVKR